MFGTMSDTLWPIGKVKALVARLRDPLTPRWGAQRSDAADALESLEARITAAFKVADEYDIGDQLDPDGHTHVLRRAILKALQDEKP